MLRSAPHPRARPSPTAGDPGESRLTADQVRDRVSTVWMWAVGVYWATTTVNALQYAPEFFLNLRASPSGWAKSLNE